MALIASSNSYDAGNKWEAKRLATTAYTILHDGGRNSKSLLGQMGAKDSALFLSTNQPPDVPGIQTISILGGMCAVEWGADGPNYVPVLENSFEKRYLGFDSWWNEVVFTNTRGQSITRKNLVFSLRSQDGGSHFDPSLPDNAYLHMKDGSDTSMRAFAGELKPTVNMSDSMPIQNGHLAIMRQVAYELMTSLKSKIKELSA